VLRVRGAKATFFLVGRMAKAYPDAVRRAKSKMPSGHVSLGILARRTSEPRNPPLISERLFSLLARVVIRCKSALPRSAALRLLPVDPSARRRPRGSASVSAFMFLVCVLVVPSAADAEPRDAFSDPPALRREILGIYDGREERCPDQTRIHQFVEMPLNHLGFVVTYWDIKTGLPPPERTANIHGVVTWFELSQPSDYYLWAHALVARGARMIILGEGGYSMDNQPPADVNRLFEAIGFRISGPFVDLTHSTRVLQRDQLIGFEQPLDPVLPGFPIVSTVGSDMSSHLVLQHRDAGAAIISSVVLTGSRGGFAASGYLIYEEPYTHRTKWIIDPFAFFRKALGAPSGPIPDVTTLSGRRIYFSHIDGDGWNNISRIDAYHDARAISAEVVLHELVAPYPDLPVSVGVIGADVDNRYGQVERSRRIARELFQLPQVEVAVHTYTHPYQWSFFENYDRQVEKQLTGSGATEWTAGLDDRIRRVVRRLFPGTAKTHIERKPNDGDPPRAYSKFPFDLEQETRGAVAAAGELAPLDKPTALYLWSGDAEPFGAAMAAVRRLGVRNMNGGDTRIDADYPSLTYVFPIARSVGAERQIYASNANDFRYITDGRDHGFLNLQATIAATEEPQRLKPVNVYYHMYAGERAAQLAAVRHHLNEARKSFFTPIAASQYAAIAEGFFTTEITALGASTWRIHNRGALQTVRFDDASGVTLDLVRSVGVIGQRRKGATLYVALDGAYDDVVVALTDTAVANVTHPYLIDGRWQFHSLDRHDCGFTVVVQGFGSGQMRWGGLAAGIYRVSVRASDTTVWEGTEEVNDNGRLALTIDTSALQPVIIDVVRIELDGPR
jgi:peptidoglycan/xylan/chitin deacetylase (PgdA/CDA1 family)